MVWAAVSSAGKLALHIVPPGMTINRFYYRDNILQAILLPEAQRLYPDGNWTFMQDGAPPHTANITQEWCHDNLPDFIAKNNWPPSSPDLNPLDYSVWAALAAKVNKSQHCTVDHLRHALQREWNDLSMDTVRNSIHQWRERLRLCIRAKGGLFEK
jgi:hypothetical protein